VAVVFTGKRSERKKHEIDSFETELIECPISHFFNFNFCMALSLLSKLKGILFRIHKGAIGARHGSYYVPQLWVSQ
jgi:hypothetical protein